MSLLDSYLGKMACDVLQLDAQFGLSHLHAASSENLSFFCTALAGEVGELLNVAKKIIRDGESEELWAKFDEEAVDVLIYLIELLVVAKTDLNKAWDQKQLKLLARWSQRDKKDYYVGPRPLTRTPRIALASPQATCRVCGRAIEQHRHIWLERLDAIELCDGSLVTALREDGGTT